MSSATPTDPDRAASFYGGFSSSICGLFSDPNDRSSCGALVCCGSFLQARNHYALTGSHPPWLSHWSAVVFLAVFILPKLGIHMGLIPTILLIVLAVMIFQERKRFRALVLQRITPGRSGAVPAAESTNWLRGVEHRACGCVSVDDTGETARIGGDFCHTIWRLAALCCCGCCGFWCQCCGMCAIGQEHRELRRVLPPEKFLIDYITFQPYKEYAGQIELLRQRRSTMLKEHVSALSRLSTNLIKFFIGSIFVLMLLTGFVQHFEITTVLIILGTFLQAIVVLYVAYWKENALDISLDAVIKMFASGFLLATTTAFVIEEMIDIIPNYLFLFLDVLFYAEDHPEAFEGSEDNITAHDMMHDLYEHHIFLLVAYAAFKAFVTAGLIEELCKHFCFWTVEHTDFMEPQQVEKLLGNDGTNPNVHPRVRVRNIHARAAALRTGLIATATGFACCENLLYVFVGGGQSVTRGMEILLLRSLLPLHPVAAAVQSIGVIQRELEGAGGVGNAVIPAILLHGTFDFVLMLPAYLLSAKNPPPDSTETQPFFTPMLLYTCMAAFFVMVSGLVYWFVQYKRQSQRLTVRDLVNRNELRLDAENNEATPLRESSLTGTYSS